MSQRAQTIVISTRNRTLGKSYDGIYNVPAGFVKCEPGETMSIMLQSCTIYRSWQQINALNNWFEYRKDSEADWTRITIPPGNYRYVALAQLVTRLIPGTDDRMEYLVGENMVQFVFDEVTELRWAGSKLYDVLGFLSVERMGTVIRSDNTIAPVTDSVYLFAEGIVPKAQNVSNIASSGLTLSTILGYVPLNANPYTYVSFRAYQDENKIDLENEELNYLRLMFVTADGEAASFLPDDFIITLRVFFTRASRVETLLEGLNETNRMQLLSQALQRAENRSFYNYL